RSACDRVPTRSLGLRSHLRLFELTTRSPEKRAHEANESWHRSGGSTIPTSTCIVRVRVDDPGPAGSRTRIAESGPAGKPPPTPERTCRPDLALSAAPGCFAGGHDIIPTPRLQWGRDGRETDRAYACNGRTA